MTKIIMSSNPTSLAAALANVATPKGARACGDGRPIMNKCKYCDTPTQDPDCCCEVCEGIANYWWDWAEAFHQPLVAGIEKGMPDWVVEYWTDW